ncbi:MAG: GHMP family kinase ATP-binding protein [Promethearchaeota archaeon]
MIKIKAPGRICLFGEHQDYLNYPVIAMAISKYIYLEAKKINEKKFFIELPDINEILEIKLNNKELEYNTKRDYLKSGYNQFLRRGIKFDNGYKIQITGDIPINAGVSSSSAMVMSWLYFLNIISGEPIKSQSELALMGYHTEVIEFNEAGGMMDHFSSIYGNLIYLKPNIPLPNIITNDITFNGFVLGNSLEKKETVKDLIRVKNTAIKAFNALKEIMPDFNQFKTSLKKISQFLPNLEKEYQKKIIGNILNRDISNKAKKMIFDNFPKDFHKNSKVRKTFYQQLGLLLNSHHKNLRDKIEISTNKIEKMINNCLDYGALGAKINGSGFGGTMFALGAEGSEDLLIKAIEEVGGKAYLIKTSEGVENY